MPACESNRTLGFRIGIFVVPLHLLFHAFAIISWHTHANTAKKTPGAAMRQERIS